MVLRPYQFYAVEKILDRVQNSNDNGYIWHTTGAGKTLTSFKAAQLVSELDDVDKVMFVVDRHDLDTQTQSEYEAFEPGAVDSTDNTDELVKRLQSNSKIIITTIQKLNAAVSKTWYSSKIDAIRHSRIVMIFDECHRSHFGDSHKKIMKFLAMPKYSVLLEHLSSPRMRWMDIPLRKYSETVFINILLKMQ